jgi:hypothetical protein
VDGVRRLLPSVDHRFFGELTGRDLPGGHFV